MSKTIQYTLRIIANHKSWFGGLCLYPAQSLVRHGNRVLTESNFFLPLVVCFLLFFVIPDSVCLANSPYINKVYDFRPAPGQFTNLLPKYEAGDDAEAMRSKAETALANNNQQMISLGGWGGYIVFGFDHPVVNSQGDYDLIVLGNAFYTDNAHPEYGGSSEPGIVCVSYDANGNGLPDDPWYELAGSAYNQSVKHYQLTYSRPAPDHVATPDEEYPYLLDSTYIAWQDNQGHTGYLHHLSYHTQPYFPQWLTDDQMVFDGNRLPDNFLYDAQAEKYVQYAFDYGYADNHPNTSKFAKLKLDWAVNNNGSPANLSAIHFVKVYTAVHQQCGSIGETSTEILGSEDLHPEMSEALTQLQGNAIRSTKTLQNEQILIHRHDGIYNLLGTRIQ